MVSPQTSDLRSWILSLIALRSCAAASQACDSKHPGFYHLISRIPIYKSRLRNLDPPEQVSVAVLCTLGARASPHHVRS